MRPTSSSVLHLLAVAMITVATNATPSASTVAAPASSATPFSVNWVMYPGAATAMTTRKLVSFNLDWHPPREGPTWGQNASYVCCVFLCSVYCVLCSFPYHDLWVCESGHAGHATIT